MPFFGVPIRNGLPIGLGSVAGFGVQQFSPADLFSAGEQGAWYDPSDFSTLFTDSAGTTPVTAVEQFVGLMLDKSKGLVLGQEYITNLADREFTSDTGFWSKDSGATISGGALNINNASGTFPLYRFNFPNTFGGYVEIAFDLVLSAGAVQVVYGPAVSQTFNTSQRVVVRLNRSAVGTFGIQVVGGGTALGTIDNISVRELPGNHAFQTNSLKRPKLAARYNLLTYTEQFDNAAWVRTGIAAFGSGSVANTTATTDPLGGNTADFLLPFNAANRQRVNQGATVQTSTQMRMTCYIKPGGYSKVALRESNTSGYYVSFDLSSTASPTILASSNATGTVSHVGNGWFLCSMTTTIVGTNFGASVYVLSPTYTTGDPETPTWTPDQVSGIYVWGADLRPADQATGLIGPTYQRVVDAATYDTVGFLPYLAFDGLSWSMSTGSIDFATVTSDGQARRNLLSVPTLFNSSPWVVTNVTLASGVADAFGGNNAWTLTASAANGTVSQNIGSLAAGSTISCYIRRRTGTGAVALWVGNAYLNITVTGSWQRVEVAQATTTTGYFDIRLSTSGDAVDVMYPQVETGSPATAFQNIGTDKMTVFAGVRKLSDAAFGALTELGNWGTNVNGFNFAAPSSAAPNYGMSLLDTSGDYPTNRYTTYSSPITNVLQGSFDRAKTTIATQIVGRINGLNVTASSTVSAPIAASNFGNLPLYIGMRNNASFPFNGWLTSLIVRGAQSTQSQIEATEAWVNGKTGAF